VALPTSSNSASNGRELIGGPVSAAMEPGPDTATEPSRVPDVVLAPTMLGHACAESGLYPEATIRIAEELSECMNVGIPPASDEFCLYLLLSQSELVLRNARSSSVLGAAVKFCTNDRRKAHAELAADEKRRASFTVPDRGADSEDLNALRRADGRMLSGQLFMASFLVDAVLKVRVGAGADNESGARAGAGAGDGSGSGHTQEP